MIYQSRCTSELSKTTIGFLMSVRPSVWNNSAPTGRIFMFFCFFVFEYFFENQSRKIKLNQNWTRIKGTLHADRYTFSIMSRSVLLRMKNVSVKSCRETRNTHFVFNNFFFFENRAVYEIMWGKFNRAEKAADDDMAHAHCI
jgi:hypothetical protein